MGFPIDPIRVARAQLIIDKELISLESLDFQNEKDVLEWIERVSSAVDERGVRFDRAAVSRLFVARGWPILANMGAAFDGSNSRNFAGYIVGQWISNFWPEPNSRFIREWKSRFLSQVAP